MGTPPGSVASLKPRPGGRERLEMEGAAGLAEGPAVAGGPVTGSAEALHPKPKTVYPISPRRDHLCPSISHCLRLHPGCVVPAKRAGVFLWHQNLTPEQFGVQVERSRSMQPGCLRREGLRRCGGTVVGSEELRLLLLGLSEHLTSLNLGLLTWTRGK